MNPQFVIKNEEKGLRAECYNRGKHFSVEMYKDGKWQAVLIAQSDTEAMAIAESFVDKSGPTLLNENA